MIRRKNLFFIVFLVYSFALSSQNLVPVGEGWANNSVNTTVFRKNSLITQGSTQFIAYYAPDGYMMLGKRSLGSRYWALNKTQYKGNVSDAHNSISIMVDGGGYLHVSWDHHGNPLRYAKGITPYSIELGDMQPMAGSLEKNVTYPEFFKLPDGNLIFMYRDGQSGSGNLVINKYDAKSGLWTRVQDNLIDGENKRNAYWQTCVDNYGTIHISWVWRETPDVATNHDMCYAKSDDGGVTWKNSKGNYYNLPIKEESAERIADIPQNSELINQTSMTTDTKGNPYIASYWKEKGSDTPQYHIIYYNGKKWENRNLDFRALPFSLKGGGTKRIPISRPQIIVNPFKKKAEVYLLFRDVEREEKASIALCKDLKKNKWQIKDLTDFSLGAWEPSYDTELWRNRQYLHVFIQKVEQIDGEGKASVEPQKVYVLELDFSH